MAERGRELPKEDQQRIKRLSAYTPIRQVAKLAEVSRNTARKYIREEKR